MQSVMCDISGKLLQQKSRNRRKCILSTK